MAEKTSTKTREELAEVQKQLNSRTSTTTRKQLEEAQHKLAALKTKTRTREELRKVEEEIARERAKEISSYTVEVFKKKQELLKQMLAKNKNVDVAFLLDCTGSMAGYINEAKNQIKKIVQDIGDMYENKSNRWRRRP